MSFEEFKQLTIESIYESKNMNDLIQSIVNKIYQKGFNDGQQHIQEEWNTYGDMLDCPK